jgi:hypothetical protein
MKLISRVTYENTEVAIEKDSVAVDALKSNVKEKRCKGEKACLSILVTSDSIIYQVNSINNSTRIYLSYMRE